MSDHCVIGSIILLLSPLVRHCFLDWITAAKGKGTCPPIVRVSSSVGVVTETTGSPRCYVGIGSPESELDSPVNVMM